MICSVISVILVCLFDVVVLFTVLYCYLLVYRVGRLVVVYWFIDCGLVPVC